MEKISKIISSSIIFALNLAFSMYGMQTDEVVAIKDGLHQLQQHVQGYFGNNKELSAGHFKTFITKIAPMADKRQFAQTVSSEDITAIKKTITALQSIDHILKSNLHNKVFCHSTRAAIISMPTVMGLAGSYVPFTQMPYVALSAYGIMGCSFIGGRINIISQKISLLEKEHDDNCKLLKESLDKQKGQRIEKSAQFVTLRQSQNPSSDSYQSLLDLAKKSSEEQKYILQLEKETDKISAKLEALSNEDASLHYGLGYHCGIFVVGLTGYAMSKCADKNKLLVLLPAIAGSLYMACVGSYYLYQAKNLNDRIALYKKITSNNEICFNNVIDKLEQRIIDIDTIKNYCKNSNKDPYGIGKNIGEVDYLGEIIKTPTVTALMIKRFLHDGGTISNHHTLLNIAFDTKQMEKAIFLLSESDWHVITAFRDEFSNTVLHKLIESPEISSDFVGQIIQRCNRSAQSIIFSANNKNEIPLAIALLTGQKEKVDLLISLMFDDPQNRLSSNYDKKLYYLVLLYVSQSQHFDQSTKSEWLKKMFKDQVDMQSIVANLKRYHLEKRSSSNYIYDAKCSKEVPIIGLYDQSELNYDVLLNALNEETGLNCSICFDTIMEDHAITPCVHIFHEKCINTWLETENQGAGQCNKSCPLCRREIV